MRSHVEMRTVYIDRAACEALPQQPMLAEISRLLRELILALLEEPVDYDENRRGGIVARLILTELTRLRKGRLEVPMPRDARALRVARALLDNSSIDHDLDRWADAAGASRRTLARLRAIDGLAVPTQNSECRRNSRISLAFGVLSRDKPQTNILTARDEVLGTIIGTTSHQTNECVVIADLLALTRSTGASSTGISRKRRQSRAVN